MRHWVSRGKVYNEGGHILGPRDAVAVKFVTVIGNANDFAVYMGKASWNNGRVATDGNKVSEDVGRAVAPYCQHLHYRR